MIQIEEPISELKGHKMVKSLEFRQFYVHYKISKIILISRCLDLDPAAETVILRNTGIKSMNTKEEV